MTALIIAEAAVILLLGLLVAGLLRSHAEILRQLDSLGAGLEHDHDQSTPDLNFAPSVATPRGEAIEAHDISGTGPEGDGVGIRVLGAKQKTLLAFLSSGCLGCAEFWETFNKGPDGLGTTRLVVLTKGDNEESPSRIATLASGDYPVVMSDQAWNDYQVPGSPYFVLVDGATGSVAGEGSASTWDQLLRLMGEALDDTKTHKRRKARADADREDVVDRELQAAGIHPGHPSLYPDQDQEDEEQ